MNAQTNWSTTQGLARSMATDVAQKLNVIGTNARCRVLAARTWPPRCQYAAGSNKHMLNVRHVTLKYTAAMRTAQGSM